MTGTNSEVSKAWSAFRQRRRVGLRRKAQAGDIPQGGASTRGASMREARSRSLRAGEALGSSAIRGVQGNCSPLVWEEQDSSRAPRPCSLSGLHFFSTYGDYVIPFQASVPLLQDIGPLRWVTG